MNVFLDHALVAFAIAASAVYAFARLAPRALKIGSLRFLSRVVQSLPRTPGANSIDARLDRALERLGQPGCGGCGSCPPGKDKAGLGGKDQQISPDSIGRRTR